MPKQTPKTEPEEKTDDKPAEDKPVARKDEQRTFGAPGIERLK